MAGRAAALPAAAAAALAFVGAAAADNWQVRLTPAGNAAARAAVVKRADLGTTAPWKGGPERPGLSPPPACAGWKPKRSGLVVVGAAGSDWSVTGIGVRSTAVVFRTAKMLALDWRRSVVAPQVMLCLRRSFEDGLGSTDRVASVRRVAVPKLATYTALMRVVLELAATGGGHTTMMIDALTVGSGRTEIALWTTAPYGARAAIEPAELRLARALVARSRAWGYAGAGSKRSFPAASGTAVG
jgi:hypothetical protein